MTAVAVLVPCRDEALTVAGVVQDFREALPGCTVVVCDNASADDTAARAAAAGAVVTVEPRPGKGHAVRRLLEVVDADVYVLVDGDGTYDASAAPLLVDALRREALDMVVATRVPAADASDRPGHRLGNAFFTRLVRTLYGGQLTDVLSGYRVLSRALVDDLAVACDGFEVEVEMTARALTLGAACGEVPTSYAPRVDGSASKLRTVRDGWRILTRAVLTYAEQVRPAAATARPSRGCACC